MLESMTFVRPGFLRFATLPLALCFTACSSDSGPASAESASSGGSGSGEPSGSGGSEAGTPGNLPNLSSDGQGGTSAEPAVDCSALELNPCIEAAIAEAMSCLQPGRVGVFSADRTSCSFPEASGVATFPEPMPSGSNGFRLNVELEVGGDPCASYVDAVYTGETQAPMTLTTQSHTVSYLNGPEIMIECDGVTETIVNQDLAQCGRLQVPELSKDVLLGFVDVFFNYGGGKSSLLKCDDPS
jgi:hypothetical protein